MINNKNNLIVYFFALLSVIVCYSAFGFYYERYEPMLVGFLSGFLTPGMVYDDLFYLAHIILAKFYGNLYAVSPNLPWLNIFHFFYLLIVFVSIGKILQKQIKNNKFLIFILILFSIFFIEFYVLHVMTRISYVLSFTALLKIILNFDEGKKSLQPNMFYILLFGLAVLIRSEPPSVVVLLVSGYYFLVYNNDSLKSKVKNSLQIFILPTIMCVIAMIWVAISIKTIDEFYIKIEPDVEYELTARNNIVPIEKMESLIDSMRYQAVYLGIWGDATTNDDVFLRSLIGNDEIKFKYLANNAIMGIQESVENCTPIVIFNTLLFLLLFGMFIFKSPFKAFRLFIFHAFFYFVIFLFAYKIKMIVTSLSPIMFIISIVYIILFINESKNTDKSLFFIISLFSIVFQTIFLYKVSQAKEQEYVKSKEVVEVFENLFHNKNLFLDEKSFKFFLGAFKPFQLINVENIDKVYAYDNQHTSTIQPYKTYLAKDCNCDPNNYQEYFNFILSDNTRNVFYIEKSKALFLKDYLEIVHNLKTNWKLLEVNGKGQEIINKHESFGLFIVERRW